MERQRPEQEPIVALEEHVDYWDQQGWRDPFSSREWTERQEDYAAAFGNGNVYTRPMGGDWRLEFVGSRGGRARGGSEGRERHTEARRRRTRASSNGGRGRIRDHD